MVIYKFGGASVKDAASVLLLKEIIQNCSDELIVVISAMGKTTNKLEKIIENAYKGNADYIPLLDTLEDFHKNISRDLMPSANEVLIDDISSIFKSVKESIGRFKKKDFNLFYDQIVSMGEILSTKIVSSYLNYEGVQNRWIDIRDILKTDDNFREARIDFSKTDFNCKNTFIFKGTSCYITQGFIGSSNGFTTTLGREGSDYTAAILANAMDAKNVNLWKDVNGIYNADPAAFKDVCLLKQVSYQEMIELAFYGAKVIHPKTLKPLKDKQIPLYVKSFYKPEDKGTEIGDFKKSYTKVPVIILKESQVLISLSLPDLNFILESHISRLFALLNNFRLKANLMQHSAVSFSICVDKPRGREVEDLIDILKKEFKLLYNDKLNLLTIRNYDEESIRQITLGKKIYIEQRSRNTVQFVTS